MYRKEPIGDKTILKDVNRRLTRTGVGSGCRVTVAGGRVTLSGQIQHERQRQLVLKAVDAVEGIKTVMDQITVRPRNT